MRYLVLIFLLGFLAENKGLFAQDQNSTPPDLERTISMMFDSAKNCSSDSLKLNLMSQVQQSLFQALTTSESYLFHFKKLKAIGEVTAPDNAFRLFTWNIYLSNYSCRNFGIIQKNPNKEQACKVNMLHDNTNIDSISNATLSTDKWYGALYYKILANKVDGKTYYTLLGYDAYSPVISKKLIDILYFDEFDRPHFGAPIINMNGKLLSRLIFSYNARLSVLLNYDELLQMIIFDHLSPSETEYTGQFEYYGPDFSYDGLEFKRNQWQLVSNIKSLRQVPKK